MIEYFYIKKNLKHNRPKKTKTKQNKTKQKNKQKNKKTKNTHKKQEYTIPHSHNLHKNTNILGPPLF